VIWNNAFLGGAAVVLGLAAMGFFSAGGKQAARAERAASSTTGSQHRV
jgi:hypothetical protein